MFFDYEAQTINFMYIFPAFIIDKSIIKEFFEHGLTLIIVLSVLGLIILSAVVIMYFKEKNNATEEEE